MLKFWMMFAFLISISCSSQGLAAITEADIIFYESKTLRFLCDLSFCFEQPVPFEINSDLKYLAYVPSNEVKIQFSPKISEVELKASIVHEYAHIYRHRFNKDEKKWLDEGIAKLLEYLCLEDWPDAYNQKLLSVPRLSLSDDERDFIPGGEGYHSAFLLVLYLYNHFGEKKFLKEIMNSKLSGWDNITKAINKLRSDGVVTIPEKFTTKTSLIWNFSVALWMNDAYASPFSLFLIDPKFKALKDQDINDIPVQGRKGYKDNLQIFFSKGLKNSATKIKKFFTIRSYQPFQLEIDALSDYTKATILLDY